MRTIRTKVYQFSELSKAAQQTAIENNRDINVDYYWYQVTFWDALDIGLKLDEFDIDSASFVRDLTGEFINPAEQVANAILKEHGKDCETYKTSNQFLADLAELDNNKEEAKEQAEEELQDVFLHDLLIDYTKILQDDLEYRSMESAVIETLTENEYEFKQDGTRF